MKDTQLTLAKANELGGAIADLAILSQKVIKEKDDAAKQRALTSYIGETLMQHCNELLSRWFVVEQEYAPLLASQATFMGNCLTILQRRNAIQEAQAKQTDPAACPCTGKNCECVQAPAPAENVVTLVQPS